MYLLSKADPPNFGIKTVEREIRLEQAKSLLMSSSSCSADHQWLRGGMVSNAALT